MARALATAERVLLAPGLPWNISLPFKFHLKGSVPRLQGMTGCLPTGREAWYHGSHLETSPRTGDKSSPALNTVAPWLGGSGPRGAKGA